VLSSTLLILERSHLELLALWGLASLLVGGGVLAALAMMRGRAALLRHFALQMLGWGLLELAFTAVRWHALAARDYAGAVRLTALVAGTVVAGATVLGAGMTLAVVGRRLTERVALVGAGAGLALQGAALVMLDVPLLRRLLGAG
jgi:hypothetical protein